MNKDQLFLTILENIHDGIIAVDKDTQVIYINPAAEAMCAANESKILGKNLSQTLSLLEPKSLNNILQKSLPKVKESISFKDAILKSSANTTIVDGSITALPNKNDELQGFVFVLRDISQLKKLSAAIDYQASHDQLTGLLNREGLALRLDETLDTVKRAGGDYTLMQIEIDKFDNVTTASGAAGANAILIQFSEILKTMIQRRDVFARIGNSSFALILIDCNKDSAQEVAERIHRLVNSRGFNYENKDYSLTMSMGLVQITETASFGEALLLSAENAVCEAKRSGGNKTVMV
jgi:diguanylate cyclase (GGDEF)-like protein/PAS domain S-box-containing protein